MAQTYGPFFSGSGSSFNETQWRELFGNLITPGVIKGGLVNGVAGGDLAISAPGTGMTVNLATGVACAYGFLYENDATLAQAIAAADATLNRIDYLVLELLFGARTVLLTVKQGTLASSPVAPTLTQNSTTWDIPLATVLVSHGVSSIVSGNLTDMRQYAGVIAPSKQGSGSGLNADLVDGLNSSAFVLGSGASQHIIVLNRAPTNADGVDGDIIFQY